MPVKCKHRSYTSIVPPVPTKGKGLRITWREPLGDIRIIDIERKPQYLEFPWRCSDLRAELKADRQASVQAKREVAGCKLKQMSYAPNGKLRGRAQPAALHFAVTAAGDIERRRRGARPPAQSRSSSLEPASSSKPTRDPTLVGWASPQTTPRLPSPHAVPSRWRS